jgi:hypothetical protein
LIFQSDRNKGGQVADGKPFKSVNFDVSSASAAALMVNIPWIHGPTDYYTIPIGTSKEFVAISDGSWMGMGDQIYVKTSSGIATYSGGITA